ncbi:YitT family protein [Jeotgalibaca ciconiae]|uniref:YitT family protein n=1 Tax=Jeotgalibaca ciconiae TaxID=2496265 RepID=UPI00223DE3EF|nr:YitT family protein [Jeotgalibaca ciconiae]
MAVNFFFRFTGLAPGGITGLSIVFSTILGVPIDIMSVSISLPLLALGMIILGKNFGIKTLYITLMTPLFMRIIPALHITAALNKWHPILELIVAALLGGVLVGSSIGIALNRSCATGGTDLIALLLKYFLSFLKLSHILLVLDGFVVVASGVINNNLLIAVFSFISLLIIIKTIAFFTQNKLFAPKLEQA